MLHTGAKPKVGWIMLWAVLLISAASFVKVSAATNPFAEVPADHWSYGALRHLQNTVFEERPSTGRVNLIVRLTRVEMAIEVAEILDRLIYLSNNSTLSPRLMQTDLDAILTAYNESVTVERKLQESDVRLIEDLIHHYRPELEALGYRIRTTSEGYAGLDALTRALGRLQIEGPEVRSGIDSVPISLDEGARGTMLQLEPLELTNGLSPRSPYAEQERAKRELRLIPFVTDDFEVLHREDVLARFGELAGEGWDELALHAPPGFLGMQSGVMLGQLGSTVLVGRRSQGAQVDYVAGLDGAVELDRFTVGATVLRSVTPLDQQDPDREEGTIATVQGSYRLSPGIMVTAGLSGSIWGEQDASLLELGGVLQFSDSMSLEAVYRLQEAGYRTILADADPERLGFDLEFDIGYAKLTAGLDRQIKEDVSSTMTTTSLGLLYPVNELTVFRASRQDAVEETASDSTRKATTELGVDLSFPRVNLNVKLGYALIERWTEQTDPIATGRTSETELGVEYQLPSGSFALRYKVVDVSGDVGEPGEAEGRAEITIRF